MGRHWVAVTVVADVEAPDEAVAAKMAVASLNGVIMAAGRDALRQVNFPGSIAAIEDSGRALDGEEASRLLVSGEAEG